MPRTSRISPRRARPAGITRIEQANATFGWHDGKPFLHCHAVWTEADGARRGGHILPAEAIVVEPGMVQAWGFTDIAIETSLDPETNFTLFQPSGASRPRPRRWSPGSGRTRTSSPRWKTIARDSRMPNATIRGSLGSLIGAQFENGTSRAGRCDRGAGALRPCHGRASAEIDLLAVDGRGHVHEGWLERGANPVCITFDLVLTSEAG